MTAISQLDPVTTLAPNDAIPVEQAIDGVTRYATPAQIQVAAGALIATSNLADLENEQAARNNLGLGVVAVLGIGNGLAAGGGNLAVQFGTQTGTVADGGALEAETTARITGQTDNANAVAAAQSTANAAAPQTALNTEASTRAQADTTNAEAAAAAQATASAAMPSTVTALEALFLQWIETNPAAFGIAYGTWLDSLPTSPNISGPPIWWSNTGTPTYS